MPKRIVAGWIVGGSTYKKKPIQGRPSAAVLSVFACIVAKRCEPAVAVLFLYNLFFIAYPNPILVNAQSSPSIWVVHQHCYTCSETITHPHQHATKLYSVHSWLYRTHLPIAAGSVVSFETFDLLHVDRCKHFILWHHV